MQQSVYDITNDFRHYEESFALVPNRLNSFSPTTKLTWHCVQFSEANKQKVSKKKGIYAFVIKGESNSLPPHGYVLYVGISRKRKREIYLRTRYSEYLRDQKKIAEGNLANRPQIGDMLYRWRDAMYFYFCELDSNSVDIEALEKELNDALVPPISTQDFSTNVRKAKKAW